MKDIVVEYKKMAKKNNTILTIFMLTHNREHYLELAIKSIQNQTYDNFILFILDNESEDGTQKMVSNIKDDRLLYLKRKSSPGDSNTLFARDICCTDFFAVLHDDDIYERDYLLSVMSKMISGEYDALSVSLMTIDENGNEKKRYNYTNQIFEFFDDSYFMYKFKNSQINSHIEMIYPTVIYRTSFYKNFVGFDGVPEAGPCGDQYLWFDTERKGGKIAVLDRQLVRYRRHSNQESNAHAGFMQLQLLDFLLSDPYYQNKLNRIPNSVVKKIWDSYKTIFLKYYKREIDVDKYKSFFDASSVQYIRKYFSGKVIYFIAWFIFKYNGFFCKLLNKVKSVRNINGK